MLPLNHLKRNAHAMEKSHSHSVNREPCLGADSLQRQGSCVGQDVKAALLKYAQSPLRVLSLVGDAQIVDDAKYARNAIGAHAGYDLV